MRTFPPWPWPRRAGRGLWLRLNPLRPAADPGGGPRRRALDRLGQYRPTNVPRTGRKDIAAGTLMLDALKATAAVLIFRVFSASMRRNCWIGGLAIRNCLR